MRAVTNAANASSRGPPSGARAANVAIAANANPGTSSAYGCRGGRTGRNVDRRDTDRLRLRRAEERADEWVHFARDRHHESDERATESPAPGWLSLHVPPLARILAPVFLAHDRQRRLQSRRRRTGGVLLHAADPVPEPVVRQGGFQLRQSFHGFPPASSAAGRLLVR